MKGNNRAHYLGDGLEVFIDLINNRLSRSVEYKEGNKNLHKST